ncbi:hypothetical protein JZ751_016489 [Albula glossodonta]|uniref:Uncharacterized protein n=1 Tax=Albula glossodonta TaxID=121402 RepID=A0A8T2NSE3_9TELE|nr:hypothetical protein JZ751_016489 [Albula glossodonta]
MTFLDTVRTGDCSFAPLLHLIVKCDQNLLDSSSCCSLLMHTASQSSTVVYKPEPIYLHMNLIVVNTYFTCLTSSEAKCSTIKH